jgi:ribosomal-protein-alanine N-acetyltransferase
MNFKIEYLINRGQISGPLFVELIDLDKILFPNPWSEKGWEDFLKNTDEFLISTMFNARELVGFAMFARNNADSFAHLLKIIIHNNHRGQGLGKELLSGSINYLQQNKIGQYFLEVECTNESAIKLYTSLGFSIIHKKRHFYGVHRDAYIMTTTRSMQ